MTDWAAQWIASLLGFSFSAASDLAGVVDKHSILLELYQSSTAAAVNYSKFISPGDFGLEGNCDMVFGSTFTLLPYTASVMLCVCMLWFVLWYVLVCIGMVCIQWDMCRYVLFWVCIAVLVCFSTYWHLICAGIGLYWYVFVLYTWYVLYILIDIILYWYASMCNGMYCLYWYVNICIVCNGLYWLVFVSWCI